MKGFTGAKLLSVAAALAGLAAAKQINKARMVQDADMAAIPNLAMLEHVIELTQRGPNGGWRVWGSQRGGGGSGSKDVNVNVGLTATVTADVEVSGPIAATVEQVCPDEPHTKMCSPGFCSDLSADAENYGSCGAECPKHAKCDDPFNNEEYPCECPLQLKCLRDGACREPVCGERCMECPWNAECDPDADYGNGKCICPAKKSKLCEPTNALPYCANIWGDDLPNEDEYPEVGGDVFNCGACGYKCPQADWHGDYTAGYCFPTLNPVSGQKPAHCDCGDGHKLCGTINPATGGGVCAPFLNDKYCGLGCGTDCTLTGQVCDLTDGRYSCITPTH